MEPAAKVKKITISGPVGSGKTKLAMIVMEALKHGGYTVVAESIGERDTVILKVQ